MRTAVEKHLNPQLARLGIRKLARNAQAATAGASVTAKHSFDGKSVESWLADLLRGLVDNTPNLVADWGLATCRSRFLRGITATLRALGRLDDYRDLLRTIPVLRDFALGMSAAMKMKPSENDYLAVERHLPKYVVGKLMLWKGSNTWYDNHCMSVLPAMMRQWGSLRLVSQEGMEAWQKKLNEILRLNNGFANAGAIPLDVKDMGQEAVDAYLEIRAADRHSDARWVYEQALMRTHAIWQPTIAAAEEKKRDGSLLAGVVPSEMDWRDFYTYWQRWLTCIRLLTYSLPRIRLRGERSIGGTYYTDLRNEYYRYHADCEYLEMSGEGECMEWVPAAVMADHGDGTFDLRPLGGRHTTLALRVGRDEMRGLIKLPSRTLSEARHKYHVSTRYPVPIPHPPPDPPPPPTFGPRTRHADPSALQTSTPYPHCPRHVGYGAFATRGGVTFHATRKATSIALPSFI